MDDVKLTIDTNQDKKGLAIIIHNNYDNDRAKLRCFDPLSGTAIDGKAMKNTFANTLKFATIVMENEGKSAIKEMFEAIAKFKDYPAGYRCIAIYFSGHGGERSKLYDNHGVEFDLEEIIVQPLESEASERVKSIRLLMFIDACRGRKSPLKARLQNEDLAPKNMMIGYASKEKYSALENEKGGVWTQHLVRALQQSGKPIKHILEEIKDLMRQQNYREEALPDIWNPDAGNICLNEPSSEYSCNYPERRCMGFTSRSWALHTIDPKQEG